jgi:wobble nucleotide-excising tRNase
MRNNIAELEREIVEFRRPAEELNADLAAYLGRDDLRLEVKSTGYRMLRNGQPATHLSEGERTAIAFLYFLKSLSDRSFDMANGIVVIDDPVSSLDANALYSAFGYMKERTKAAGQLFILTHSFSLFRLVRNWFHHLPGQGKKDVALRPARFFMLAATAQDGARGARLAGLDPLLEQHESEYHYLFKRVHLEAGQVGVPALERHYEVPNVARRLLEAFLSFRFPNESDLHAKLEQVEFDSARKTRILRFLHTYSHHDSVAHPAHDLSALSETTAVLKDVLVMMQHVDRGHFDRMVEATGIESSRT